MACRFIGNSPSVAMKHYALIRDTDFLDEAKSGVELAGYSGNLRHVESRNPEKPRELCVSVPRRGVEPLLPP